jgi:hypothetical protein
MLAPQPLLQPDAGHVVAEQSEFLWTNDSEPSEHEQQAPQLLPWVLQLPQCSLTQFWVPAQLPVPQALVEPDMHFDTSQPLHLQLCEQVETPSWPFTEQVLFVPGRQPEFWHELNEPHW